MRLQEGLNILTAHGVDPDALAWMHWSNMFRVGAADLTGLGRPHSAEVKINNGDDVEVRVHWTVDGVEFDAWNWCHQPDSAETLGWLWMVALVDVGAAKAAHEAMGQTTGTTFSARREVSA